MKLESVFMDFLAYDDTDRIAVSYTHLDVYKRQRQDKPFETAEDILMHLLDGGFSSAPYFRLQASGTYLADFHPTGFALIDLTVYHNKYLGKRHLKDELGVRFPQSHSFLYRGDVFLFLHGKTDSNGFSALAEEFQLKVVISDGFDELFELPALYYTCLLYTSTPCGSPRS